MYYNLSYTRSHLLSDLKTPRSVLKNWAIAKLFNQIRGVLKSDNTRLSSVWYSFSNETVFQEKFEVKVGLMYGHLLPHVPTTSRLIILCVFFMNY